MPKQNLNSYLVISKATQHLMGGRTLFALGFSRNERMVPAKCTRNICSKDQ
jgi:hypothetical protein